MAIITTDDVRKLAKISAIHIEESELENLTEQLGAVLTYASSLKDAARTVSPKTALLSAVNITREDIPQPYNTTLLLEQAPQREGDFFVVPVIVKQH